MVEKELPLKELIGKLKNAEEELRESEEKYRTLFETSKDTVYITSKDGKWIDVNLAGSELFGYEKDDLMKINVRNLYENPEERKEFTKKIEEFGFVKDYEVNLRKKDDSIINSLITATAMKNDAGKIIGYQGFIRDITERKQMEEELRKSEEKYRGIVRNAVEGIYRSTIEGEMLEANSALLEFFGYESEEEFKVDAFRLFLHPERRENFLKELEEKGEVKGYEIEYKRKDGKIVIGNEFARLIEEDGKKIIEGIIHDITKRKEAERKLEESHKKLQQSYERIKEESSLKMEFVRDTSHQFINPLCIVDGYLYLLKKGEFGNLTAEQKKTIDRIHKNFLRINELVQKMIGIGEKEEE
jgi:PAS domain S-box-containing protein